MKHPLHTMGSAEYNSILCDCQLINDDSKYERDSRIFMFCESEQDNEVCCFVLSVSDQPCRSFLTATNADMKILTIY